MRFYEYFYEPSESPGVREGRETHCPCCGAVADTYYRNAEGEIVGCEHCLQTVCWYELTEQEEFE